MTAKPTKPTSVAAWKKNAAGNTIELPSGCTLKIRRTDLLVLMKTGMIPNSLMGIVQKAVAKGQGFQAPSDAEMAELASDPKQLNAMFQFFDDMVCYIAVEPEIHKLPKEGVERDEALLYVDEVELEDKMFLFQVVTGGTTDVEQFRSEHASRLEVVRRREDVELPTE